MRLRKPVRVGKRSKYVWAISRAGAPSGPRPNPIMQSDVYIRVTLKGQGYVETYGPTTNDEAYQRRCARACVASTPLREWWRPTRA